jgi:hypothetical protein
VFDAPPLADSASLHPTSCRNNHNNHPTGEAQCRKACVLNMGDDRSDRAHSMLMQACAKLQQAVLTRVVAAGAG